MTVKKAYLPIVEFLTENSDKKVKSILDEVIAMCSAKASRTSGSGVSNFIRDANGNVVAINDYYFKRWMPLVGEQAVEFGAKRGTPTGFNSMSKEGVSNWTKQQRQAKQAHHELLNRVAAGEITPDQIPAEQAKIEEERKSIVGTELGFATIEELVAYLNENGVSVQIAEAA